MESIIDALLNGGPFGLFAGYLIWQSNQQQKRLDGYMEQINDLEDKAQTREDLLRSRYDDVILKIEKEKSDLIGTISARVISVMDRLNDLQTDLKLLNQRLSRIETDIEK